MRETESEQGLIARVEGVSLNLPVPGKGGSAAATPGGTVGGAIFAEGRRRFIRALHDISFTIETGDRIGIVGHNGAGKSSLLRLLAGIYRPSAGECHLYARPACLFSTSIGMHSDTTVRENVRIALMLYGVPRRALTEKGGEVLAFADMESYSDVPLGACSSGMRTRLGFAIVTSVARRFLLVDEVVMAGDAAFRQSSRERIEELTAKAGALVMTTHSLSALKEFCTRGIWLQHGRILADGPIDEVLKSYRSATAAVREKAL